MNERKGKPSASGFYRYVNCPGSWLAEKDLPEEPPGPDAEYGNKIHALLAEAELDHDELDTKTSQLVLEFWHLEFNVAQTIFGPTHDCEVTREKRLWAKDGSYSGKPDVVYRRGNVALVIDYKTGWNPVDEAAANDQGKALVWLVHEATGCTEIYFAVIQPNAPKKSTLTKFSDMDLLFLIDWKNVILNLLSENDTPQNAGTWCNYCKARHTCPELHSSALIKLETGDLSTLHTDAFLDLLERKERAKQVLKDYENKIKAIDREAINRLLRDRESLPGWRLRKGAQIRKIEDAQKAYERLAHLIDLDSFVKCCAVKVGELTEAVAKHRPLTEPQVKALMAAALGDVMTVDEREPTIAREDK